MHDPQEFVNQEKERPPRHTRSNTCRGRCRRRGLEVLRIPQVSVSVNRVKAKAPWDFSQGVLQGLVLGLTGFCALPPWYLLRLAASSPFAYHSLRRLHLRATCASSAQRSEGPFPSGLLGVWLSPRSFRDRGWVVSWHSLARSRWLLDVIAGFASFELLGV
jgi:hypothetical protein